MEIPEKIDVLLNGVHIVMDRQDYIALINPNNMKGEFPCPKS